MHRPDHPIARRLGVVTLAASVGLPSVSAAVTWHNDPDEWTASAGEFTTIDFLDLGALPQVLITDQYESLGVVVDPAEQFVTSTFGFDGVGARNADLDDDVRIRFTAPITHFAVLEIASVRFKLYLDGELVGSIPHLIGDFTGVASDIPFNEVEIIDSIITVNIDDMYLSAIPGPGPLAVLLPAALLGHRGRRRP